jgi:Uma2 family endonuclease
VSFFPLPFVPLTGPDSIKDETKSQPDILVLTGPRSAWRSRIPNAPKALLVVEVGGSTLGFDTGVAKREYAAAGVPQNWVVDIPARRIEVYRAAAGRRKFRKPVFYPLDTVVPLSVTVQGAEREFEGISVQEVLQDSITEGT